MEIKKIYHEFSVCKVADYLQGDMDRAHRHHRSSEL